MKQADKPVTKAEFDEGMQMVTNAFENVVTKKDLEEALIPYATKEDLQEVKEEILGEMKSMFESAVERIEDSVLVTQRNQEKRITALERR